MQGAEVQSCFERRREDAEAEPARNKCMQWECVFEKCSLLHCSLLQMCHLNDLLQLENACYE